MPGLSQSKQSFPSSSMNPIVLIPTPHGCSPHATHTHTLSLSHEMSSHLSGWRDCTSSLHRRYSPECITYTVTFLMTISTTGTTASATTATCCFLRFLSLLTLSHIVHTICIERLSSCLCVSSSSWREREREREREIRRVSQIVFSERERYILLETGGGGGGVSYVGVY